MRAKRTVAIFLFSLVLGDGVLPAAAQTLSEPPSTTPVEMPTVIRWSGVIRDAAGTPRTGLLCERDSATCSGGYSGKYVDGQFHRTVVTSADIADPRSAYIAMVSKSGVLISTAEGTFQGVFIPGTPAAQITGKGEFAGMLFRIDSSDVSRGVLASGEVTFKGTRSDFMAVLERHNPFTFLGAENLLGSHHPTHPGTLNYRFSRGNWPNLFDYGPSPHFVISMTPGGSVPQNGVIRAEFHVDSRTGFVAHGVCAFMKLGCQ